MQPQSGIGPTNPAGHQPYDGVIGDLHVALFLAYVVLLVWRTRGAESGTPPDWWIYIAIFAALNFGLNVAARLGSWWRFRREVRQYREVDPAARPEILRVLKASVITQPLAWEIEREGDAEIGGDVERFPFARGARVHRAGFRSRRLPSRLRARGASRRLRRLDQEVRRGRREGPATKSHPLIHFRPRSESCAHLSSRRYVSRW